MYFQKILKTAKTEQSIKHYFRAKYVPDCNGGLRLTTIQGSNRAIFSEKGYECLCDELKKKKELYTKNKKVDNIYRNLRAARVKAFDYILSNPCLNAFVTFTYNPENIDDCTSYEDCYKTLSNWLENRVKRNNLKYVIVPERHKKGGIHFHGVLNKEALKIEKSLNPYTGMQIKRNGRIIYNLSDWKKNGFSTVEIIGKGNGDRDAVAKYVFKYMTKEQVKIGGRYFLHGGKLNTPIYKYSDSFEELCERKAASSYREITPVDGVVFREWTYL